LETFLTLFCPLELFVLLEELSQWASDAGKPFNKLLVIMSSSKEGSNLGGVSWGFSFHDGCDFRGGNSTG
jgi:hypothetical protein